MKFYVIEFITDKRTFQVSSHDGKLAISALAHIHGDEKLVNFRILHSYERGIRL